MNDNRVTAAGRCFPVTESSIGARAVYSPIANIEEDLGSMNTQGEEHLAFIVPLEVYRAVVDQEGDDPR